MLVGGLALGDARVARTRERERAEWVSSASRSERKAGADVIRVIPLWGEVGRPGIIGAALTWRSRIRRYAIGFRMPQAAPTLKWLPDSASSKRGTGLIVGVQARTMIDHTRSAFCTGTAP